MDSNSITLAYCRKYEPRHLVDELLENMAWVDRVVELSQIDRHDELWSNSAERIAELRRKALGFGATWCIIMAPDERLQDGAEELIRAMIRAHIPTVGFTFKLREMWTPTQYRADGAWGNKIRRRITNLEARGVETHRIGYDLDIMHLKMIEPENRKAREEVHTKANTWDNRGRGFDYMTDETGLKLMEARPFSPPYRPYRFTVPQHLLDK